MRLLFSEITNVVLNAKEHGHDQDSRRVTWQPPWRGHLYLPPGNQWLVKGLWKDDSHYIILTTLITRPYIDLYVRRHFGKMIVVKIGHWWHSSVVKHNPQCLSKVVFSFLLMNYSLEAGHKTYSDIVLTQMPPFKKVQYIIIYQCLIIRCRDISVRTIYCGLTLLCKLIHCLLYTCIGLIGSFCFQRKGMTFYINHWWQHLWWTFLIPWPCVDKERLAHIEV